MRRNVLNSLVLAGLACGALGVAPGPVSIAEAFADARSEARQLTLEGDFAGAKALVDAMPEEDRNDPKFRMRLGDMALSWTKSKDGAAKTPGLLVAKEHFAAVAERDAANADAATAAVETGLDLVAIQVDAKQPVRALTHADWSVKIGEAALEGGSEVVDLRLAVAAAHDQRAKLSHKINDFDRIVGDYTRSAELNVSCADSARKPAAALGQAARTYLDLATFISEGRPIKEETRDEGALLLALDTAVKACETERASKNEFTIHLLVLRAIHRAKNEGSTFEREDLGKPYMQELGKREGLSGLALYMPKGSGWKRITYEGKQWDRVFERQLEGDTSAVQIMIKGNDFNERYGGKKYNEIEFISGARYEGQMEDEFKDVSSSTPPELVSDGGAATKGKTPKKKKKRKKKKKKTKSKGKGAPEIWHYEIAGTMGKRRVRVGEWLMVLNPADEVAWRIRIIDWRTSTDLLEPDIVEFVRLALGFGGGEADDDGKKGKKKR